MFEGTLHYVEFALRSGNIPWSNFKTLEIAKRDFQCFEIPEECIGFRFFDLFIYDEGDEKVIGSQRRYETGWIYIGREYSLEEVRKNFPEKKWLIEDMVNNAKTRVAFLKNGGIQELEKEDTVISIK